MALTFVECRAICNNFYVQILLSKVKGNIEYFEYFAKIFSNHKENHSNNLDIIDKFIENTFRSPKLTRIANLALRNEMINIFKQIYRDKQFSDIRSKFLEAVVFTFGPFSKSPRVNVYIEPKILDNGELVGKRNNRCDNVFHVDDKTSIRLIECKADIFNYIPRKLPLSKLGTDKRQQILYLVEVHEHLTKNYIEPEIFVTSYNVEYEEPLKNARENWGYSFFNCLNPLEIINIVKQE